MVSAWQCGIASTRSAPARAGRGGILPQIGLKRLTVVRRVAAPLRRGRDGAAAEHRAGPGAVSRTACRAGERACGGRELGCPASRSAGGYPLSRSVAVTCVSRDRAWGRRRPPWASRRFPPDCPAASPRASGPRRPQARGGAACRAGIGRRYPGRAVQPHGSPRSRPCHGRPLASSRPSPPPSRSPPGRTRLCDLPSRVAHLGGAVTAGREWPGLSAAPPGTSPTPTPTIAPSALRTAAEGDLCRRTRPTTVPSWNGGGTRTGSIAAMGGTGGYGATWASQGDPSACRAGRHEGSVR